MLLLRSLLFNSVLYFGIVVVFIIALPTLFLPPKFTLFFGKLLGHYVVFVVKIFLNTGVEFKGKNYIPKDELGDRFKKSICETCLYAFGCTKAFAFWQTSIMCPPPPKWSRWMCVGII